MILLFRKDHGVVELCAFKQRLDVLYYLLSVHEGDDKLAIWCRLVAMAQRPTDIDAIVAFTTLKLMTEPPPPPLPEPTEVFEDGQGKGLDQGQGHGQAQGVEKPGATAVVAELPTVNTTWKRVHACKFEVVVTSQLASNICDDAKVYIIIIYCHLIIYHYFIIINHLLSLFLLPLLVYFVVGLIFSTLCFTRDRH